MRSYLLKQEAYLSDFCDYAELKIQSNGIRWQNIVAQKIVYTEGYYLRNNPLFSLVKLYPAHGEMLTIVSKKISDKHIVSSNITLLPLGNDEFRVGSTYNWQQNQAIPTAQGKHELSSKLDELLDHPYKICSHNAGIRPTVADRRPVLGFSDETPAVGLFNGLGSRGVMNGPYFAEEMAQMIVNPAYFPLSEVQLQRFTQLT